MKIIMTVMAVLLFPVGGLFAQSVAVSPSPKSYSVVGSGDASLGMTRWPNFVSYSSDNPGCGEMLKKVLSKQLRAGTPAPAAISGLTLAIDFKKDIGTAYNKTAAIMVTWTVRIEGAAVEVNPWTWGLCSPWHGSVTEDFPGGDAKTMLYVNGVMKGRQAVMTLPAMPQIIDVNVNDPTVTGSVTLTKADFPGNVIPDTVNLSVMWVNDTYGSSITSPANQRNMTVFILPVAQ